MVYDTLTLTHYRGPLNRFATDLSHATRLWLQCGRRRNFQSVCVRPRGWGLQWGRREEAHETDPGGSGLPPPEQRSSSWPKGLWTHSWLSTISFTLCHLCSWYISNLVNKPPLHSLCKHHYNTKSLYGSNSNWTYISHEGRGKHLYFEWHLPQWNQFKARIEYFLCESDGQHLHRLRFAWVIPQHSTYSSNT